MKSKLLVGGFFVALQILVGCQTMPQNDLVSLDSSTAVTSHEVQKEFLGSYKVIKKIKLSPKHELIRIFDIYNKHKVAYVIQKKNYKDIVVVNEEEISPELLLASCVFFSPDGNKVAYRAKKGVNCRYDRRFKTTFCEDTIEFVGINNRKISPDFDYVVPFFFTSGGHDIIYRAERESRYFMMINNKALTPGYSGIQDPILCPDGKNIIYPARRANRSFIMMNSRALSREFAAVSRPCISSDGKKVAYGAKINNKWVLMVNNERKSQRFDGICDPTFSSDGNQIAYGAKLQRKWFVMVGNKKISRGFDKVWRPIFSPDGTRIAYGAELNKKWFIVVDNKRISPEFKYDNFWVCPLFDSTGENVLYLAKEAGLYSLMINSKKNYPEFDEITFDLREFKRTGEITVAGYNRLNHEIIMGVIE